MTLNTIEQAQHNDLTRRLKEAHARIKELEEEVEKNWKRAVMAEAKLQELYQLAPGLMPPSPAPFRRYGTV